MHELLHTLPTILRQAEDTQELRESVVFAVWRHIAGEGLRERAVPIALIEKKLIVAVADKTWKRNIEDLSGQMIFKINSMLKQTLVTFIDFQINAKVIEKERLKRVKILFDDEELKEIAAQYISPKIQASANSIKDESLREQFLLAAGSSLAQKHRNQK